MILAPCDPLIQLNYVARGPVPLVQADGTGCFDAGRLEVAIDVRSQSTVADPWAGDTLEQEE
jgi:hypothetical protein